MRKNLTELVFILDRSGSMSGLEADTIGGFNGMLEKQKAQDGEANVTTVLFDDQYELICDRTPIAYVKPLTKKEYYVRGMTALLDAIGRTIAKIDSAQNHMTEDGKAEKVIFVITTDGMENASREYKLDVVRKMIEEHKAMGWEFLFLGANIDAVAEAKKFGINPDRAVRFENDSRGVAVNYQTITQTIGAMRCAKNMSDVGAEWKEEIEKDYASRGKKSE